MQRGAEAIITETTEGIVKDRVPKTYRHPTIDQELRVQRTRMESRLLELARSAGVPVPEVRDVEETRIVMERIEGVQLKEVLNEHPELARKVGEGLALLHKAGIIHGDLTTSNLILAPDDRVVFIDFGLSFRSERTEDRAVDVHVFKQALESKHHEVFERAYGAFLKGYAPEEQFLQRLQKVEARGRNKT